MDEQIHGNRMRRELAPGAVTSWVEEPDRARLGEDLRGLEAAVRGMSKEQLVMALEALGHSAWVGSKKSLLAVWWQNAQIDAWWPWMDA